MTNPSSDIPEQFTVITFNDGSTIYVEQSVVSVMDFLNSHDTNRFVSIHSADGEEHYFRIRAVNRVFHSAPESRRRTDEMNYQRHKEKAKFQEEKMKEHMKALGEAIPDPGPGLVGPSGSPIADA